MRPRRVDAGASFFVAVLYRLTLMSTAATIFALSSGPGRAGVAVVRVSGPAARAAAAALAGSLAAATGGDAADLTRPSDGAVLDQALVLWFPAPASFTGEDCCEFHVHGGRAVVAGVIDALGRSAGIAAGGGRASSRGGRSRTASSI